MNLRKLAIFGLVVVIFILLYLTDARSYLSLSYIQQQRATFSAFYDQYPGLTISLFFTVYVVVTAVSFPGATILTLLAGALFGTLVGVIVVSFASTLGSTLAFLMARYLLRDWVKERFGAKTSLVEKGMAEDGGFYLFTLRLVPIFPFFMINLLMGLTSIGPRSFYFVSQLGMLPGTIVYVNAGTALGQITDMSGIISPSLLGSFAALGLFPLAARYLLKVLKVLKVWKV